MATPDTATQIRAFARIVRPSVWSLRDSRNRNPVSNAYTFGAERLFRLSRVPITHGPFA